MKAEDLRNATVMGFFSLPSASLAEANPAAYSSAWAQAPAGAGSCAYCGTGILHHCAIRLPDGSTAFIGLDCAKRVGGELGRLVAKRKTTAQAAADSAAREAKAAKFIEDFRNGEARRAAQAQANRREIIPAFFGTSFAEDEAEGLLRLRGVRWDPHNSTRPFYACAPGFMAEALADLLNGQDPTQWSDRRRAVFCEIRAKDYGRRGSKKNAAAWERLWPLLTNLKDSAE